MKVLVIFSSVILQLVSSRDVGCFSDDHCGKNFICNKKYQEEELACDYGSCVCRSGFKQINETYCREYSKLDEPCSDSNDCNTLLYQECKDKFCRCKEGFKDKSGKCEVENPAELGESCEYNFECLTSHSECKEQKCTCQYGYKKDGKKCRKLLISEKCSSSTYCDGDLICHSTRKECECGEGKFYFLEEFRGKKYSSCLDRKGESVNKEAKEENESCGYSRLDSKIDSYVFINIKCAGKRQCTFCHMVRGSYEAVCRGGAGNIFSNSVLIVLLFILNYN